MAFSDLISKPITAPLEGLDKSIATGVELANSQYRTQIAMEQNQLEREKLQASYLDKANAMLPSLLKSRGKARSILMNQYINYSARGGSPVNADSMDVMLSQSTEDLDAAYQKILNSVGGDRQRAALVFRQKFGEDASEAATFIEKSAIQEQASQLAMGRAVYQQRQVTERQERKISIDELKITNQKIEKDLEKIPKKFEDVAPKIKQVENALGTPDTPIEKVDLGTLKSLFPTFAKTVAGEVGVLTEGDVARVFENTLGYKIAEVTNYLGDGKAKAPPNLVKELRERMSLFKQAIGSNAVKRLADSAVSAQKNPIYGRHYDINILPDGEVNVGYAMAQTLDRANDILINNGLVATKRLSKDKKVIETIPPNERIVDLQKFISSQAATPSAELINSVIKKAIAEGKVVKYPKPQRMNIIPQQEEVQQEE